MALPRQITGEARQSRGIVAGMETWIIQVRKLKQLLRRRGQSPDDADDLVQEAFLRLQAFLNGGREVQQPEAFLVRTALNLVTAGDRKIEALGTAFVVRRDPRQLAVTLVEGKVAVSSVPVSGSSGLPERSEKNLARSGNPEGPDTGTVILAPGERIVVTETEPVKKDRPPLDKLLAWERREVALDNTALPDAVAEMNRYNRKPVEIATAEAANVRVTGLFRAGDSVSFARAVAEAYHLEIIEGPDRVVLSGVPTGLRASAPIRPQ